MEGCMANAKRNGKQNVTISFDRKTIQKAKILATRRSTSISGLLAHQIEVLVGEEEAYERAEQQAMTLLERRAYGCVAAQSLDRPQNIGTKKELHLGGSHHDSHLHVDL
jgi:hypothetical protein